jgi:phage shock protein A
MSNELKALKECLDEVEKRRNELMDTYRNAESTKDIYYAMGQLDELSTASELLVELYDKIREK